MKRRRAAWHLAAIIIWLPAAGIASASEQVSVFDVCGGAKTVLAAQASGARDGATIELKDGRVVRLAGVIAPTGSEGNEGAARRATDALDAFVAGRRVILRFAKNETDRYGRIVAQIVVEDGPIQWLQAALVNGGYVPVLPGSGDPDCSERLLILERQARKMVRGLWTEAAFSILKANSFPKAFIAEGRFALVEASVRHVGEAGCFSISAAAIGKISRL